MTRKEKFSSRNKRRYIIEFLELSKEYTGCDFCKVPFGIISRKGNMVCDFCNGLPDNFVPEKFYYEEDPEENKD